MNILGSTFIFSTEYLLTLSPCLTICYDYETMIRKVYITLCSWSHTLKPNRIVGDPIAYKGKKSSWTVNRIPYSSNLKMRNGRASRSCCLRCKCKFLDLACIMSYGGWLFMILGRSVGVGVAPHHCLSSTNLVCRTTGVRIGHAKPVTAASLRC